MYGRGDITLKVSVTIAELENTPGSILLDCDLKKAYPGNILMNDRIAGEFPALKTRNEWH